MLIGVISDTHDNAVNLKKAVNFFNNQKVKLVICCGDWVSPFMPEHCKNLNARIISVFGNNEGDKFRFFKRYGNNKKIEFYDKCVELKLDGRMIMAYHGDEVPLLDALIKCGKYDAVFSGHTHLPLIRRHGKTLHLNPGSPAGLVGPKITKKFTIALYDTKTNEAKINNLK